MFDDLFGEMLDAIGELLTTSLKRLKICSEEYMTNKIHSAILAGMMIGTQDILMGQHIGSGSRISGELHKEPGHAKLRAKRKRERINKRNARNGK